MLRQFPKKTSTPLCRPSKICKPRTTGLPPSTLTSSRTPKTSEILARTSFRISREKEIGSSSRTRCKRQSMTRSKTSFRVLLNCWGQPGRCRSSRHLTILTLRTESVVLVCRDCHVRYAFVICNMFSRRCQCSSSAFVVQPRTSNLALVRRFTSLFPTTCFL